jgi:hypothetical protein
VTSRASTAAVALTALLGCRAESVEARAIWVDELAPDGTRRIHVYDRGERGEIEILGTREPLERVRLDPRGRGVLIRAGARRGAWFDLDDGRRLPLLLPATNFGGTDRVEFAVEALMWLDDEDALTVVPLAPGLPSARAGVFEPIEALRRESKLRWLTAASHAPIVLVAAESGVGASFLRYPLRPDQPLTIALEAEARELPTPNEARSEHGCAATLGCFARVGLDADGELAILATTPGGPWQVFDRRAPAAAGLLELPEALSEAAAGGLRLLAVLDRAVSIWLGHTKLYRYDRTRGEVESLPMFASPPLHWAVVDRGRAVILMSREGPVYRADLDGLRAVSLETTICSDDAPPVISPTGRWLAWTCGGHEDGPYGGAVLRVSPAGLERYLGVPMVPLAIDDDGDLLLYSVVSTFSDTLDGIGPSGLPRTMFVLSGAGVLTRIDDLEPGPAPVLGRGVLATYMQSAAVAH